MRCEDCLAVVEEYFDGELERRQSEQVSAHMAACGDCSEALDALASEQELYLRYDRDLEVTPALWQNVRAGVARLEEVEKAAKPLPPLTRLRARLASTFDAFAPRAAFAPALALVLLSVALGALWLARTRGTNPAPEVAQVPTAERSTDAPRPSAPQVTPEGNGGGKSVEPERAAPVEPPTAGVEHAQVRIVNASGASAPAPGRSATAGGRVNAAAPPAPDHLDAAESEMSQSLLPAPSADADVILTTANARLSTPEEKEMARHLEQAQRLLRSFQNEAGEGGDAVQVAYERRLSRKLLEENTSLQLEAEATGDRSTKQVLDTLEPFLLDIANLRDNASRDEVRSIKERMQKKEIIAALHVY